MKMNTSLINSWATSNVKEVLNFGLLRSETQVNLLQGVI